MDHKVRLGVDKIASLFANRFDHFGMTMSSIRHADSAGEIQQLAAIIRVDVGTLGAIRNEVEDTTPNGSHVRKIFGVELIGHHVIPFSQNETGMCLSRSLGKPFFIALSSHVL